MYIDGTDPRNADVLLAFEGELIGMVKEAFVATKEDGGYVLQVQPSDEPDSEPVVVRREGNVALLRCNTRDALTQRRFAEERERLGLPIPAWIPDEEHLRDLRASQLESLALKVRTGEVTITNVTQGNEVDRFPLPIGSLGGDWQFQNTGKHSYAVEFLVEEQKTRHTSAFKEWSEKHPNLIPEYVRSKPEGPR